jgi:hypothetical protein
MKNHINGTGKSTVDFTPPNPWHRRLLNFCKTEPGICLGCCVWTIAVFTIGFGSGHYTFPREVVHEKVVWLPAKITEKKDELPEPPQRNIDKEVRQLAEEKISNILQNCAGVLEIKDGEAQTVRYKKAAIGKKGGFTDIKKGVPYTVHSYFLHNKTGRGLVGDGENNIFFLDWQPGTTNPPGINPGTLTVVSGKRVEIGKLK